MISSLSQPGVSHWGGSVSSSMDKEAEEEVDISPLPRGFPRAVSPPLRAVPDPETDPAVKVAESVAEVVTNWTTRSRSN